MLMASVLVNFQTALDQPWAPGLRQEERLHWKCKLLEMVEGAVIVRDLEDRIIFWNRGAERLYEKTSAEVMGRTFLEVTGLDGAEYAAAFRHLQIEGGWSGELAETAGANSPTTTIEHHWLLCPGEGARADVYLTRCLDLTAQKRLEAETLRAKRLESIGALAGGVAHDLNNVLTPIVMAAPMLREDLPEDAREMIVGTIEESANRGAEMVRQVLTFARGVEGERVLVQTGHLIKEVVRELKARAHDNLTIATEVSTRDLWPVTGDAAQLLDVLRKICANACEAMPQGGELQIAASHVEVDEHFASMIDAARPGSYVAIRVIDQGRGIPHPLLDRIFDPFFTTREQGKGAGLGLSSALGIVRSHGGFITVISQEQKGSVFTIYLPRAYRDEDARETNELSVGAKLPRGRGELIMIADDEFSIRQVTARLLEERGFRVVAAQDGTEALAKFARARGAVKVVVTDLKMPLMDGMVLTRTLKQMDPRVRVIVSTGDGDERKEDQMRAAGVVRLLRKPYSKETLLHTVRETLDLAISD